MPLRQNLQETPLERQLGARLLERDRRNVALTEPGRQLLEDALPLLEAVNATRQRVARAARGSRRLVVGFRAGVIPTPAIAALCELHHDLVVDVKRLEWDDQELNLLSGDVGIAYVRQPMTERGLRLIPLYHERRLVALRRDHPLAEADELRQSDIADERHLRYLQPLRAGGTPIRSVEEKLEHVAAGHGIIVLPLSATRHYTRPDVVYVPVVDAHPTRCSSPLWPSASRVCSRTSSRPPWPPPGIPPTSRSARSPDGPRHGGRRTIRRNRWPSNGTPHLRVAH